MTFTDSDLKLLKESASYLPELDWDKMRALLARLEAAEKLSFARQQRLSCLSTPCDSDCKQSSTRNLKIAEEAWRKAAGKSGEFRETEAGK